MKNIETPRFLKVISCGNIIEVYTFEKMPALVDSRKNRTPQSDLEWLTDSSGKRADNQRQKRWHLIRLINSNFGAHSKFITLTFAENIKDLTTAHKEFDKFIKRMRRAYGGFKYIVVVEFQKRGAVHYHMISDLPYVPKKTLASIWSQGFVRINDIDHVDNVGAYISKYMTKETPDLRLRARKQFYTSQNLDRPLVHKGEEADIIIQSYNLLQKEKVFESRYTSEHHGNISYAQYNLNRHI